MKRIATVNFLCVVLATTISAQMKYVEKAMTQKQKNGDYYIVEIPDRKTFSVEEISIFCKENKLDCQNIQTRTSTEFGARKTVVASFEALSFQEKEKLEDIAVIPTKAECQALIRKYPNDTELVKKSFYKYCKRTATLSYLLDYYELFGRSYQTDELCSYVANNMTINDRYTFDDISSYIKIYSSSSLKGVNADINFQNEQEVGVFANQVAKIGAPIFTPELIQVIQFRAFDQVAVFKNTVNPDYEKKCYNDYLYMNNPDHIYRFIARFPNSSFVPSAKKAITDLDNKKYNDAATTNTVDAYDGYLKVFPNGVNSISAKKKIADIQFATKVEKEKRDKLIREKGADYVVKKDCANTYGFAWGDYERCHVYFADGTRGTICHVHGEWTLDDGAFSAKKILYYTEEQVSKAAYAQAKGLSLPSEGRYYPEPSYSTSSSSSSYSSINCFDPESKKWWGEGDLFGTKKYSGDYLIYTIKCSEGARVPNYEDTFYFDSKKGKYFKYSSVFPNTELYSDFNKSMNEICECGK